jgi:hypothetical protein
MTPNVQSWGPCEYENSPFQNHRNGKVKTWPAEYFFRDIVRERTVLKQSRLKAIRTAHSGNPDPIFGQQGSVMKTSLSEFYRKKMILG